MHLDSLIFIWKEASESPAWPAAETGQSTLLKYSYPREQLTLVWSTCVFIKATQSRLEDSITYSGWFVSGYNYASN